MIYLNYSVAEPGLLNLIYRVHECLWLASLTSPSPQVQPGPAPGPTSCEIQSYTGGTKSRNVAGSEGGLRSQVLT